MASKGQFSDPSSPEPTKRPTDPSWASDKPVARGAPTSRSDFEEIEMQDLSENVPSRTPTSPAAKVDLQDVEEFDYDSCCSGHKIRCALTPLNCILFLLGLMIFCLRVVMLRIKELYFEVLMLGFSMVACAVLTCLFKRGHYAKEWVFPPAEGKRLPRVPSQLDFPMEPLEPTVPEGQRPLKEQQPIKRQIILKAVVHHEEDTESKQGPSSPTSVSSESTPSSDKPVPSTSGAAAVSKKDESSSSSSIIKAYKFLFRRR